MITTLGPATSWRLIHDGKTVLLLAELAGYTETVHAAFEAATQQECVAVARGLALAVPDDMAELFAIDTALPDQPSLQEKVVAATQKRLDDFARTRNYDGILSACTYATSAVPKFAAEGQYAVQARDATWAALYALLDEVQAGQRPVPQSFEEVAPLLPELEWPQ